MSAYVLLAVITFAGAVATHSAVWTWIIADCFPAHIFLWMCRKPRPERATRVLLRMAILGAMVRMRAENMKGELRPFGLVGIPIYVFDFTRRNLVEGGTSPVWTVIVIIGYSLWWKIIYNHKDDDDRWKKRRRKLASKVKQIGRKLVVVPVPATGRT